MKLSLSSELKLTIEPIPESTWGMSLAHLLPQEIWDILRREVYEGFHHTCAICGAQDKQLHCHEKWTYDDRKRIQKLLGFQCLCVDCHNIKHWGRTVAVALERKDQDTISRLTAHFCKVNNCSKSVMDLHKVEVGNQIQKRGKYQYKVDFGKFRPDLVEKVWRKQIGKL